MPVSVAILIDEVRKGLLTDKNTPQGHRSRTVPQGPERVLLDVVADDDLLTVIEQGFLSNSTSSLCQG